MKTDLTITQLYWNKNTLLNYFFRTQSEKTLENIIDRVSDGETALDRMDDYFEECGMDLDDVEEMFYNDSADDIIKRIGLEDLL